MTRQSADAGVELLRTLSDALSGMDLTVKVEAVSSRDWTSVTFAGARHELRLRFEGRSASAAASLLEALAADDLLELRGHLLIELAVESQDADADGTLVRAQFRALTVQTGEA